MLYDAFGGVLSSTLTTELQEALSAQGAIGDADTGLVHLGNGRFYDPALGRPLQPNPAGGVPTVPQSLNRYAATSLGPVGVAEGAESNGIDLRLPIAGALGNTALEVAGRTYIVQSGYLAVRGSAPALEKALGGKGLPFAVEFVGAKGGRWGMLAVGASGYVPLIGRSMQRRLVDRLGIFEAKTQGDWGLIDDLGGGQFHFPRFGQTVDTTGLKIEKYQRGMLLGESRALRTLSSVGLTAVIDVGFELYEFGTGSGQWGNPYLTTGQKGGQAIFGIGSDLVLAGTLAFYGVAWEVAIPATFIWAILSEPVFTAFPVTAPAYREKRNLQPLP